MTVDGEFCGQLYDLHVRMMQEVGLGLEVGFAAVGHRLVQYLVIAPVVETQGVRPQVEGHILGHRQVGRAAVVGLHILVDHLFSMTDNGLYQQPLHLAGLVVDAVQADKRCRCLLPVILPLSIPLGLFLLLLTVLGYHAVHRVEQRLLLDVQALGQFTEIGRAQYLVGNQRDAPHDAADGLRALHGVGDALHRLTRLKGDEVGRVLLDILLEFLGGMLSGKRVGVVAVGQQQHLQIHAFLEQHVGTAHGSMDTRLVAII